MKKHLLLAILISLINPPLGAANFQSGAGNASVTQSSSVTGKLQPAEAQADFDLMRRALEEAHGGLYRFSTKAEMDKAFDAQRAKLSRPVTKLEFLAVMAETLARIKCGHTGLTPDGETREAIAGARLFPLRVLIEGRRLIVFSNDTPDDQTIRPGMEIVEINGRRPSEVFNRILPALPADGDIETRKLVTIQRNFGQNYWLMVEQSGEFTVKAKDAAGKQTMAKLAGVKDADRAKNQNTVNAETQTNIAKLEWSRENLSLRFLKEPDVAQIRIRGFGGQDYPQWMENTFRTLREKGTKALVIDLRGNGGGDDMYGALLVSYLTDKPFRYFDHIRIKTVDPSFKAYTDLSADDERGLREGTTVNPAGGFLATDKLHPGITEQQPGKYPFLGQTIVLINGRTFSTAADFCAVAHHLKRATFVGEETGGAYYGNNSGEMPLLTLPHSKAQVLVPLFEYWNAVPGYDGKRRGTRPDLQVDTTAANLLRGVDEQLDAALKLAAKDVK